MAGTVFKRGSSWTFKLSYKDRSGRFRQLWRGGFHRKDEAEQALAKALTDRNAGVDLSSVKVTLGDYLESWLHDHVPMNVAPSTAKRYGELLRRHIIPALGAVRLSQLRPVDIEACYAAVVAQGLSGKTALNVHRVLRQALQRALRLGLMARNVTDVVSAPRTERYQAPTLDLDAIRTLVNSADEAGHGTLVRLAVMSGLRQGELLRLTWADVDLDSGMLSVRKSKTRSGVRSVDLSAGTVSLLREHRRRQREHRLEVGPLYRDQGFVFATPTGSAVTADQLRRIWRLVRRGAGSTARFHDLRHAHATLLLQKLKVPDTIVAARLGHSRVSTTKDFYSHVMAGQGAEAAAGLDDLVL